MSGYTIEIRTGIKTDQHNVHTWIHITRPDGSKEAWGFYPEPETGNPYYGDGEVRPEDTEQEYSTSSGPISMTSDQYQTFRSNLPNHHLGQSDENPDYSIPFNKQCTQWALGMLMELGILPKIPTYLLPTTFFNPFTLAHAFKIHDLFSAAMSWVQQRFGDPLAFDLDGDGIETSGVSATNSILFDQNGDGNKIATGWISPDDGFLALDRNGNGLIDNGTELFGDSTLLQGGGQAEGMSIGRFGGRLRNEEKDDG